MQTAIETFRLSAVRVRDLGGLYAGLSAITTSAIDSSDLLRAQIVLAVSALDYFVHEISLRGMLEVFDGKRLPSDAFNRQKISGNLLLIGESGVRGAFEADIRERHGFLSFQQPDKIADAIRLFCNKPIWREVAFRLSMPEEDVKKHLRLIVERRNKIAHEADVNPTYPGERWPIAPNDTKAALDFIEKVCEAIYDTVA